MAAETGNKYAEKWTREAVLNVLGQLLEAAKTTVYIGEGLATLGLYHQWFAYVDEKFADDDEVFDTIKKIEQAYESKLVKTALNGEVNSTMAIFTLKNKHKWKDATQVEQNTNMNVIWPETRTYPNGSNPKTD